MGRGIIEFVIGLIIGGAFVYIISRTKREETVEIIRDSQGRIVGLRYVKNKGR